jgi:hypothetical protein
MVSLIVLLKNKDYPLKILLKRTRGLLNKDNFNIRISAFGAEYFCSSGELLVSPLSLCSFLLSSMCFVYPVVTFCFWLSMVFLFAASQ